MTDISFCPATMGPLFAADGSDFSGAVNAPCEREGCRWFDGQICQAGRVATGEVVMAATGEGRRRAPFLLRAGLNLVGNQILVDDDDAQHAELERDLWQQRKLIFLQVVGATHEHRR